MSFLPFGILLAVGFIALVWTGWLDHCADDDCDERHEHR
jgi:hypothetical protein